MSEICTYIFFKVTCPYWPKLGLKRIRRNEETINTCKWVTSLTNGLPNVSYQDSLEVANRKLSLSSLNPLSLSQGQNFTLIRLNGAIVGLFKTKTTWSKSLIFNIFIINNKFYDCGEIWSNGRSWASLVTLLSEVKLILNK